MEKDLTEIKVHLAEIKVDLRHHIRRTEILEGDVRSWRKDILPIQKHVTIVSGVFKLLLAATVVATAVAALIPLF